MAKPAKLALKETPSRKKDSAITLRISTQQKNILSQAAKLRHTTLTNFVIEEAFHAAQDTLADQVKFTLGDEQWQLFIEALDRPARDIPELRKLLTTPSLLDLPLGG